MLSNDKKTGRTFFDLISENPKASIAIFFGVVILIILAVLYGVNIKVGNVEVRQKVNVPDTVIRVVHETLTIKEPKPEIKQIPNTQLQGASKKPSEISAKNVLNGNVSGGNVHVGDEYGLKPRENTNEIINEVKHRLKDKTLQITLYLRSKDVESYTYANKIIAALNKNGYSGVIIGGEINDGCIGCDPAVILKEQTELKYSVDHIDNKSLEIFIPSNK